MREGEPTIDELAIAAWTRKRLLPRAAARQLLAATEALTLTCFASLARLREQGGHAKLLAENRQLRLENAQLHDENRILRAREESVPARQRRRYTPSMRFQILEHMRAYLLSVNVTAERFCVTPQTLYNWLGELERNPGSRTIGSLLRPTPPIRRYASVARRLARRMKAAGFDGNGQIAMSLARLGWQPSRRSIGRFCKERDRPTAPPQAERVTMRPSGTTTTVRGRYPNDLWLADLTLVPSLFPFLGIHVAVILDAWSRMPLASAVFLGEPCAADLVRLVKTAIEKHGTPRHFVSDQGIQFAAREFQDALRQRGIKIRYGAIGEHGSIALIERFWKTLKQDLLIIPSSAHPSRFWRPWSPADLERRLHIALVRYAYCRPHSALGGRVPAEAFLRIQDQRPLSNLAPRGRPGDPDVACPFDIVFLCPDDATLPILVPRAA